MPHGGSSKLGLLLLALTLPLGGLTPARADFTPNPDQRITIHLPTASMALAVDGDMPFVYETDDSQEAVAYLDGWQRLENGVPMPLGNFGVGTHTVKVHPVLYPERAQEVSFQVTPGITTLEDEQNVLVHLRIEPQSLSRIVPESLKIVEVNGQALQPARFVSATLPLTTASLKYRFPLSEAVARFNKGALKALTGGQPAKRIRLQGTLVASGSTPQQNFLLHDNVDPDIPCVDVKDKFIFERMWGDPNAPSDALSSPNGLAVDPVGGFVYVINSGTQQIVKYDTGGTELLRWGGSGTGPGKFSAAVNIAVSPDGQAIYVTDNALNRVQKFNPQGQFLLQWGTYGSGDGEFTLMSGIGVAPDGSVYVGDAGTGRIQKFTQQGQFLLKWGSLGFGQGQFSFASLFGVGVASDGNVYAADLGTGGVQKFDPSGTFILQWFGLSSPFNIAFSPDGTKVYVTENGAGQVSVHDVLGTRLFVIGSYGSANGQFRAPYGIGTDGVGNVYVADSVNNHVTKLTAAGTFISRWGELNSVPVGVGNRCAVDNLGHAYFIFQASIQKYATTDGGFIKAWGGPGTSDGQFTSAADVAVSPDGQFVYAIDRTPSGVRVEKFTPAGAFVLAFSAANTSPAFLDVDSQGNVYVAQQSPPRVRKFSSAGTFLMEWGSSGSGDGQFEFALLDIAIDRGSDTVYVLEFGFTHSVQTFDAVGNFLSNWGLIPGPGQSLRAIDVDQGVLQGVYLTQFGGWKKFRKDRTFVSQHQKFGSSDDSFQGGTPLGIAVDSGENLYVPDADTGKVKKFRQGCKLPPTALAGPDQAAGAYLQVALDGAASHDNGGGFLVSSVWHFSDGSPDQMGLQTTHRFYQPGTYTATLTVTDDDGMTGVDSATINVVSGPTAVIQASSLNVPAGATVDFSATGSSDPVAAITAHRWTFGDGASASGAEVSHAFQLPGTYQVTLTVEDALGLTGSASVDIVVTSGVLVIFEDLDALIRTIDDPGTVQSLLAKLSAARASFASGNLATALNELNALLNEVQAQTGKTIAQATAEQIRNQVVALKDLAEAERQGAFTVRALSPFEQIGVTARLAPEVLKVELLRGGKPLAGEAVSFRVTQGSGLLVRDRDLSSTTNAEGLAGMGFLCPNRAGFSAVHAIRMALNSQTGKVEEQILVEFRIHTQAPSFGVRSGESSTTVFQENASLLRYAIRLGDAQNLPYEGQDIEYRFTDANGKPLPDQEHGIILPRTQLTAADGMAHAAYISKEGTPTGTIYIQARPLPPVEYENGDDVAALFGAITIEPEPPLGSFTYDKHDIRKGNGQVVMPGTQTGGDIQVQYVLPPQFPTSELPFILFQTSKQNTIPKTKKEFFREESFDRITVGIKSADALFEIKMTVPSTREPQFVQGLGSTPYHGRSDMAVGQPEVRVVMKKDMDFVPAEFIVPAGIQNQDPTREYFVEARLPVKQGKPRGGVVALEVGRDTELDKRDEYVAATKIDLDFMPITLEGEEKDRITLWRSLPFRVTQELLQPEQAGGGKLAGFLQAESHGDIRPFMDVSNAPDPQTHGVRARVLTVDLEISTGGSKRGAIAGENRDDDDDNGQPDKDSVAVIDLESDLEDLTEMALVASPADMGGNVRLTAPAGAALIRVFDVTDGLGNEQIVDVAGGMTYPVEDLPRRFRVEGLNPSAAKGDVRLLAEWVDVPTVSGTAAEDTERLTAVRAVFLDHRRDFASITEDVCTLDRTRAVRHNMDLRSNFAKTASFSIGVVDFTTVAAGKDGKVHLRLRSLDATGREIGRLVDVEAVEKDIESRKTVPGHFSTDRIWAITDPLLSLTKEMMPGIEKTIMVVPGGKIVVDYDDKGQLHKVVQDDALVIHIKMEINETEDELDDIVCLSRGPVRHATKLRLTLTGKPTTQKAVTIEDFPIVKDKSGHITANPAALVLRHRIPAMVDLFGEKVSGRSDDVAVLVQNGGLTCQVNDVTVVAVELVTSSIADDLEENPGAPVMLNDDNDNGNVYADPVPLPSLHRPLEPIIDMDDLQSVNGEDDLMKLDLTIKPDDLPGEVVLKLTAGGTNIRIWKDSNRGKPSDIVAIPPTGLKIKAAKLAMSFWVEGIALGPTALELAYPADTALPALACVDKVTINVVSLVERQRGMRRVINAYDDPIEFTLEGSPPNYEFAWDFNGDGRFASARFEAGLRDRVRSISYGPAENATTALLPRDAAHRRQEYNVGLRLNNGLVLNRRIRVALDAYYGTPLPPMNNAGIEPIFGFTNRRPVKFDNTDPAGPFSQAAFVATFGIVGVINDGHRLQFAPMGVGGNAQTEFDTTPGDGRRAFIVLIGPNMWSAPEIQTLEDLTATVNHEIKHLEQEVAVRDNRPRSNVWRLLDGAVGFAGYASFAEAEGHHSELLDKNIGWFHLIAASQGDLSLFRGHYTTAVGAGPFAGDVRIKSRKLLQEMYRSLPFPEMKAPDYDAFVRPPE